MRPNCVAPRRARIDMTPVPGAYGGGWHGDPVAKRRHSAPTIPGRASRPNGGAHRPMFRPAVMHEAHCLLPRLDPKVATSHTEISATPVPTVAAPHLNHLVRCELCSMYVLPNSRVSGATLS